MKYEPLKVFLKSRREARVRMSFADVAKAARTPLPQSAYRYAAWWANDSTSHVQARAWLEAGFKTAEVDMEAQRVEFVRSERAAHGVQEMNFSFEHAPAQALKKHPAAGALKGTFSIAPGWDLTRPAFDDDELAEWEANLERKADMINEGLRGKR